METLRDAEIQLIHDKELEEDVGPYYGKYLGTFFSARGQVRADLFDDGVRSDRLRFIPDRSEPDERRGSHT